MRGNYVKHHASTILYSNQLLWTCTGHTTKVPCTSCTIALQFSFHWHSFPFSFQRHLQVFNQSKNKTAELLYNVPNASTLLTRIFPAPLGHHN